MKNLVRFRTRGFTLTETLVGIIIFILTIGMAALGLQIISRHTTNRQMRAKALSILEGVYNDLRIKSGTNNDFFYDNRFSGTRYYVDGATVTLEAFNAHLGTHGGVGIEAQIGDYEAVSQLRSLKCIARYRLGPNPYSIEKGHSLNASRLASYGGQIHGQIVFSTSNLVGIPGVGVMTEAEMGDRWIYAFTDKDGKFFMRGVQIHGPRTVRIFGYSTNPCYYFRDATDKWDSTVVKDFQMTGDVNLDEDKPFPPLGDPPLGMVPFGGIAGGVVDGLPLGGPNAPVPNAIIQIIPLQTEATQYYSSLYQGYWELLTGPDGNFSKPNLCPGNYLIFMHGSGGDNLTRSQRGDFGNSYTQRPDLRGSIWYRAGVESYEQAWEPLPSGTVPTYYAAVAHPYDINHKWTYKRHHDSGGGVENYVVRVAPGVTYDSNEPSQNHGGAHKHCPDADCPNIASHKDVWDSPLNTRFKTTTMMNVKGKIVGVEYDSTNLSYTKNEQAYENVPIKMVCYMHYTYISWSGDQAVDWTWMAPTEAMQNSQFTSYYAQETGFYGGFIRGPNYYYRSQKTDSGGNFFFQNFGPRILRGDMPVGVIPLDKGMIQKAQTRIGLDTTPSYFGVNAGKLPDELAPVFIIPFEGDSDLERFAVVNDPSMWQYEKCTYEIPHMSIFPSTGVVNLNAVYYGGYHSDRDSGWWWKDRPTYFLVQRNKADPAKRDFDLGSFDPSGKVRMLKKSELVRVSGQAKYAGTETPLNQTRGDWNDKRFLDYITCGATVTTFGMSQMNYPTWSTYVRIINFDYGGQININTGDSSYDFGQNVLPSLPNWNDPAKNNLVAPYYHPTNDMADGKGGFGNNRAVTFKCVSESDSDADVELRIAFMTKKRLRTPAAPNIYDSFDYLDRANYPPVDPILFNLVSANPGSNATREGTIDTAGATALEKENLPGPTGPNQVIRLLFKVPNLPSRKTWFAVSRPQIMLPGTTGYQSDVYVDTDVFKTARPTLWVNVDYTSRDKWRTYYNHPDGSTYYRDGYWHANFIQLDFDENAPPALQRYTTRDFTVSPSTGFGRVFHRIHVAKIAGHVTSQWDGKPVKDAEVQLRLTWLDPSKTWHPYSGCSYFQFNCSWNLKTDENGYYEFTDGTPHPIVVGGWLYEDFKLKFRAPVSCDNCRDENTEEWLGGLVVDAVEEGTTSADWQFPPKYNSSTQDTIGAGTF